MSSDSLIWTGTVIQTLREDNHTSLAVDVKDLPLNWGERLRVEANGVSAEAFFHGSMKTWSIYPRIFGRAAASALAADPGIDVYAEGDRIMGGVKVPGHQSWFRLRAALGSPAGDHALFQLPVGASVAFARSAAPVVPEKPKRSSFKNGVIQAVVLASHPHGLMLNVDAPLLRKLEGMDEAWYEIEVGGKKIPVAARRGISLARETEVWGRPDALLFDFEAHWVFEKLTVMTLSPMQMKWRGKFPDAPEVTTAVAPAGSLVTLRVAQ